MSVRRERTEEENLEFGLFGLYEDEAMEIILAFIKTRGDEGATEEEIAAVLDGMNRDVTQARVTLGVLSMVTAGDLQVNLREDNEVTFRNWPERDAMIQAEHDRIIDDFLKDALGEDDA